MFTLTSAPTAASKLPIFEPIMVNLDVITDKYNSSGTLFNQFISIVGADENGNCICEWTGFDPDYTIGNCVYFLSGAYVGQHKIYRINGTSNFHILTKFVSTDSSIGVHYIQFEKGTSVLRGQLQVGTAFSPVKKIIMIPVIKSGKQSFFS